MHGGGKQITEAMARAGLEVAVRRRSPRHRRERDRGRAPGACRRQPAALRPIGPRAVGLIGDEIGLQATRVSELGEVGTPLPCRPQAVLDALAEGMIPVVAPIAEGPLNVNADDAAAALAVGLGAERILFLTDVPGVLRDELVLDEIGADEVEAGVVRGRHRPEAPRRGRRRTPRRPGGHRRHQGGRLMLTTRSPVMHTYARTDVTFVDGQGCVADRRRRDALPRLRRGNCGRRARARAPGAARRRAGAARPALARLEPLLDRADGPARRAALRALRRRRRRSSATRAPRRSRRRSSTRARRPASPASSRSRTRSTAGRWARSRRPASPAKRAAFEPLVPGVTFAQLNDAASLEAAVGPDTGLILIEPVQGEGGVNPATPGFLAAAAELAAEHGALLCFDEVQTGVGRTGTFFAFEQLGVRPAPGHARQGPRQRPADRRAARRRRRAGRASCPATTLHLRRQPGRLRRRLRGRRDRRRGPARERARPDAQLAEALPGSRRRPAPRPRDRPARAAVVAAASTPGLLVTSAGPTTLRLTPPLDRRAPTRSRRRSRSSRRFLRDRTPPRTPGRDPAPDP